MPSLPFVSAVCVTGKSQFHVDRLLPVALECFLTQTYPVDSCEVILVSDADQVQVDADLAVRLGRRVRLIKTLPQSTVGHMRNAGLTAAKFRHIDTSETALVIQWDDDDWHHSTRIQAQVEAWEKSKLPVFLQRQLAYSFVTNCAKVRELPGTFIHGTVLHELLPDIKYPDMSMGEDTQFLSQFPAVSVIDNDPRLYVHISHGRNSWSDEHIMREPPGRRDVWDVDGDQAALLQSVIGRYGRIA